MTPPCSKAHGTLAVAVAATFAPRGPEDWRSPFTHSDPAAPAPSVPEPVRHTLGIRRPSDMKAPRTPPWQRRHLPRAAVCGAFGLGRPIQARRTGGAYLNRVWRLDTERGSFAVKVLNQRFEDPIRRAEYRA